MSKQQDGKKKRKQKDKYQVEREWKSIMSILKVAEDGKEHRYKEIKAKTGLSDPTLTKLLNRFTELKIMKQRWDTNTYPHASYYKPEKELVFYSKCAIRTENLSKLMEPALLETKDPFLILEWILIVTFRNMVQIVSRFKENKNMKPDVLNFVMDGYVWEPFKALTWKVLESSKKIIDEVDFNKLRGNELELWKFAIDSIPSSLGE